MNDEISQILKCVPKSKQKSAIKKVKKGYPVQYVIGNVEFFNCNILVNKNVLIPRFETEFLVDKTLKLINIKKPSILDVATGSGCIAIALKKNLNCEVDAFDNSRKALYLAKKNAKRNNVSVNFFLDNINNIKVDKKYDVIISNPPYVAFSVNVDDKTRYEPQRAIFAEDDGLYYFPKIFNFASKHLNSKGILAMEIGHDQGEKLLIIAKKFFPKAKIYYENDLADLNRYFFVIVE